MKNHRLLPSLIVAAALALLFLSAARAEDDSDVSSIKFSDPSKPGTVKISLTNGDVRITGADRGDVSVRTELKPDTPTLRKDGLRVISSSSSYSLTEKNNVVLLTYGNESFPSNGGDFDISVPRHTNILVSSAWGGDIAVANVDGNIEIKSLNGEVKLRDLSGSALVETTNGEIDAAVQTLQDGKPLSFTSMNGEVTVHLPSDAKANIRLRTHNGSILTDFDDKALVTKTESVRVVGHHANGGLTPEAREAVRNAMRDSAAAIRDASRAARDAARHAAKDADDDSDVDTAAPVAPIPPIPPLPPMTGGKIVNGTLNGGGAEIRITTMNGDVTLRKVETGK